MGRILPYGDRALMLELASLDEVLVVHRELAGSAPAGVIDIVPAARTVAVTIDPAQLPLSVARAWLARAASHPGLLDSGPSAAGLSAAGRLDAGPGQMAESASASASESVDALVIDVDYSGADLAEVARILGWSVAEVIAWHSGCRWRVAFCGFSPGFGYLVPESAAGGAAGGGGAAGDGAAGRLRVPRRQSPRTSVPAGSVALADEFSAVYPRQSPGGWQLIGQTDAVLWDASRDSPALLTPGREVRFRPVGQGGRR